jgi:ankyrin repeat protein
MVFKIFAADNRLIKAIKQDDFAAVADRIKIDDINQCDKNGLSPLYHALVSYHDAGLQDIPSIKDARLKIIKLLMQNGADIFNGVEEVQRPIVYAMLNPEICCDFLSTFIKANKIENNQIFMVAANYANKDAIEYMSTKPGITTETLDKALLAITKSGYGTAKDRSQIVKDLIMYGANINFKSNDPVTKGDTPLLNAIKNQDKLVVQMLLESGADLNVIDPDILSSVFNLIRKFNLLEEKSLNSMLGMPDLSNVNVNVYFIQSMLNNDRVIFKYLCDKYSANRTSLDQSFIGRSVLRHLLPEFNAQRIFSQNVNGITPELISFFLDLKIDMNREFDVSLDAINYKGPIPLYILISNDQPDEAFSAAIAAGARDAIVSVHDPRYNLDEITLSNFARMCHKLVHEQELVKSLTSAA